MTRRRLGYAGAVVLAAAALAVGACGQDDTPAPAPAGPGGAPAPGAAAGDRAKGQQVWMANCVACHNPDPARDGALGPAVKGSTPELLEARVLRAEYPPGYTPKRPTKVMPPRPDLQPAIPDLAAYLR
jgi:mono/diheme cytochrome c family protein